MEHKQLISLCVEILDTFNVETRAADEHFNEFLEYYEIDEVEFETFIEEIFSGCVRYRNVLRVVVDGFYAKDGKMVRKSEYNLYRVFCYIALFRLDELGFVQFRKVVSSQDINKMHQFLTFLFDDKHLVTWMKDEWMKLYDPSFVQKSLLSPIRQWLPEALEFLTQMDDRIKNKVKPKKPVVSTTEMKPFNLTKPRPRSIPMPEPIPKLQKHRPVPKTLYEPPKEQESLSHLKIQNRRTAEDRLMEASRYQFACANPELSAKTINRMHKVIIGEENKLDFEKHTANPLPNCLNNAVPIKLNTATILREGNLYKKKEEDELKKLEKLEAGAKDASEFLKWQTEMRKNDMDEQLAEIERRRIEGKLSHEEAILARKNLVKENKTKVQEIKAETKKRLEEYLHNKLEEEQEMKRLVEIVTEGHHNAKDAKKRLQEYKAKIVQEVQGESKELLQQALEEAEAEMRRKMELIHQIRAMESVPVIRQKFVDLTETAGYGLLSEMSIAELKERLSLLRIAEAKAEDGKRDEILSAKQTKDQILMDTLDMISKHRTEKSRAAALKFEERKKTRNNKTAIKDDKLDALQKKLDEKRQERLKEQENSKIKISKGSALRTQALINEKKAREESRWAELEQTRDRTAKLASKGIHGSSSATRLLSNNRVAIHS
ncbi:cilia- and flagella-associated protein 99-like [Tubulanus polymorphus]|uniref:cilia- and flagella-associated protein 99-like n=1 Tax=Tubulanus polymorphus TaxID=672921 RepID=UPI003DA5484E